MNLYGRNDGAASKFSKETVGFTHTHTHVRTRMHAGIT